MNVRYGDLAGRVGARLGPTEWLVIDQARIDRFAEATDDHQWIHVDPQAAADGPFGATIAHGYLTLSLVNRFMPDLLTVADAAMGVNYGCEKVRFPSPVRVGSRIRGTGELVSAEPAGDGLQVLVRVTVEIEGQQRPACVADTLSRFFP
ncbi:MAG: MaoC family dehydratase [Gammaproteobacteria bacterium]|nr:MaoC family dehydratase [Gammaproteobacteria bacterium]MDE0270664.1 MaoC family dehydratase [Gammaproteobacteria bacterium]